MLGQPLSMLIPEVVGFRLTGRLPEGATATDLVLTVTQMLRKKGVVGKFVEFFGPGLADLALADRATIANMAPEYGATCGIFPVDAETLRYLRFTGRPESLIRLVEAYTKEQGLFHSRRYAGSGLFGHAGAGFGDGRAEPGRAETAAGPRGAGRREESFAAALPDLLSKAKPKPANGAAEMAIAKEIAEGSPVASAAPSPCRRRRVHADQGAASRLRRDRGHHQLHQHIQSVGDAGGRSGGEEGRRKGPANEAVGQDEPGARLEGRDGLPDRSRPDAVAGGAALPSGRLRLHHLHRQQRAVAGGDLRGNRRQRPGRGGRAERQPQLRGPRPSRGAGQLPRLAAAGRGLRPGRPRGRRSQDRSLSARARTASRSTCKDLWPTQQEVRDAVAKSVHSDMFTKEYGEVFKGDEHWQSLPMPEGDLFRWDAKSTYVKNPPYFDGMKPKPDAGEGHKRRPRLGGAGRQHHDRPHLAGRLHQEGRPRRQVPDRARRRAAGLQLLRLAPRQRRGDGARHVRQRPPAQPAGAGHGGRRDAVIFPTESQCRFSTPP